MQRNIELKTLNLRRLDLEQNISLKYIETSQNDNNKPMTTVVAIKSSDGIILASDSQGTNNTIKDLEISKIFRINDSIGVGAAGDIGHIRVLIDKLKLCPISNSLNECATSEFIKAVLKNFLRLWSGCNCSYGKLVFIKRRFTC